MLNEEDWELLLGRIQDGKCTPFLGAGINYGILPTGAELAKDLANKFGYPFKDVTDLARVSQFVAVKHKDGMWPKNVILKLFREKIKGVNLKAKLRDLNNPLAILADLPLPVFMTTNYDDLMLQALQFAGKKPRLELCKWNDYVMESCEAFLEQKFPYKQNQGDEKDYPIVFHLHGHQDMPESLVLTEDDYLDFLVGVTKNKDLLPPRIKQALSYSSLLFVGYRLADMNFRVLFRGLMSAKLGSQGFISVSVQLPPDEGSAEERQSMQNYLDQYFDNVRVKLYWGTADEFTRELRERWEKYLK